MSFHKDYVETYRSNRSYWEKGVWPTEFDVVIIGGGFTGLYSALYVKQRFSHLRVLVMDRGGMTMGASSRNAGFICFGSPSEILSDIQSMGEAATINLLKERFIGTQAIKRLFDHDTVNMSFEGGSEIFRMLDGGLSVVTSKEIKIVNDIIERATGLKSCYQQEDPSKFGLKEVDSMLHSQYEGKVDPAKMIVALTQRLQDMGVHIWHRSSYLSHCSTPDGRLRIETSDGTVCTHNLVFCTNALGLNLGDSLDIKPGKNQVYVTNEILHDLKGTYHLDEGYIYFRSVGQRILIGGGRHLNVENDDPLSFNEEIESYLMKVLRTHIKTKDLIRFEHRWMGHIGIGAMKSPIVKKIAENVFVGLRMGGMGVALAPSVGLRLSDLLNETING